MRSVRRSIQVVLVWLTTVTTLIASVPHFNCVCPNGNQKQFCLGLSSSGAVCCCGGSCCAVDSVKKCCDQGQELAAGSQGEQTCCWETKESKSQAPETDTQIEGRCCTKTLANGESIVAPTKTCTEQNSRDLSVPATPLIPFPAISPAPGLSKEVNQLPPPTDLVITLKHFII